MDTHDEETKEFFAHSKVQVRLAYRGWRDQKNLIRHGCGLETWCMLQYESPS